MKTILAALAGLCFALAVDLASAQLGAADRSPAQFGDVRADRPALQRLQREEQRRAEKEQPRRLGRARQNCEAHRGTDCDTADGLREWVLLERSRPQAVLDRVLPPPPDGSR